MASSSADFTSTELSLIDCGISNLKDLPLQSHLLTINLHSNYIQRLENLSRLSQLCHLDLSSNEISRIEDLDSLRGLRTLNLSCNMITVIEGLSQLKSLMKINLSFNQIDDVSGFKLMSGPEYKLSQIELHGNHIQSAECLAHSLSQCCNLRSLTLFQDGSSNPICHQTGYRSYMLSLLPQINSLDGRDRNGQVIIQQDKMTDIPGIEGYMDYLLSTSSCSSVHENQIIKVITPKIDEAMESFKIRCQMSNSTNTSTSDIDSKSPRRNNTVSREMGNAEINYGQRLEQLESQISHLLTNNQVLCKEEKESYVNAIKLEAERDVDTEDSETVCNRTITQKSYRRTRKTKVPNYQSQTSSTKAKKNDRKHPIMSSSTEDIEFLSANEDNIGRTKSSSIPIKSINLDQTHRQDAASTYGTLMKELDTERERRMKSEQASKKLVDYIKDLQEKEHLKPSVSTSPASPVSVKRNIENYSDETSKRLKTDSNDRSDSPPPEADILRDENIKGIYIRKFKLKKPREFKGQSKNRRIYDNRHACLFCGKVVLHIGLHLQTHKTEEEVKDQSNLPRLRKLGDDKHNRKTIDRGEGEIFLARRPTDSFNIANYGPCPACHKWVKLKGLKEHHLECTKGKPSIKSRKKDLVVLSQVLAGHIQSKQSPIMQKEVLTIMKDDIISKIAQEDALITALGESLLRRNVCNIEKRKYYASARMHACAKLLQNLRELKLKPKTDESKDPHSLWDFLRPQYFEEVVLCSLKCSFPSADDIEDLQSPSNILKLKHDIRNTVNSKWAFIVKSVGTESNIEAKECRTFLQLMEVEWREKAQTLVRAVLNRRRYEEVKELPSPSDIECLTGHLNLELRNLTLTSENFRRLVVVVQTKLLLFNKRRSGELEAIKLHSYVSRSTGLNDIDQSLANDLSDVEKHMMETQDLMKVRGKRGRPVPVLVSKNCRLPLAFLADQTSRRDSGVRPENTYLFPNSVNSYARAYDSLKEICSEVNLVAPHRITSVSMRKYTATLTQVEWVCNHLGHTTKVHKEHYRQMSGLLDRTQISKLLLIQDLNLTSKYKGKKLEDMDIRAKDDKTIKETAIDATSHLKQALMNEKEIKERLKNENDHLKDDVSKLSQELQKSKQTETLQRETLKKFDETITKQEREKLQQDAHINKKYQEVQMKCSALNRELDMLRQAGEKQKSKIHELQELLANREQEHREELKKRYTLDSPQLQSVIEKETKHKENEYKNENKIQQEKIDQLSRQYTELEDEFRMALQIEASRFQQVQEAFERICEENAGNKNELFGALKKDEKASAMLKELSMLVKEQKGRISELSKSKQEQTIEYKERVQTLEAHVEEARKRMVQFELLKKEKNKLVAEVEAQQSVIDGLKAERKLWGQELAQQGSSLAQDRGRLEAKIETLQYELKTMQKNINRETDVVKIKTKMIDDQTESIRKLKEGLLERDDEIKSAREEALKIQKSLEEQLADEKNINQDNQEMIDRLQERKEDLKQQINEIQSQLEESLKAHSVLNNKWKEKSGLISELEQQVGQMKQSWSQKEKKLTEERDRAVEAARLAIAKLKSVDETFRKELESKDESYQQHIGQLEQEKNEEIEHANRRVFVVEEEMRDLLRETEHTKRGMEEKIKRMTRALGDLQSDLL